MMPMTKHEICLPKTQAVLGEARAFTERMVADTPFAPAEQRRITLAIDEAVTSLVRHAESRGQTDGLFALRIALDEVCLSVAVTDSELDCMQEGFPAASDRNGLGLLRLRAVMDEVNYLYLRGLENQLLMTKFTPVR